jgi:hypothetical protein
MIEFKAECGHTVRAKDDDEGKVVRCSYCGRETQVPSKDDDDLNFLFSEVEKGSEEKTMSPRQRRRAMRKGTLNKRRSRKGPDPFNVALKMGYAAIIIIVLIVGIKFGWREVQRFQNERTAGGSVTPVDGGRTSHGRDRGSGRSASSGDNKDNKKKSARGLITQRLSSNRSGLYVCSFPRRALVYYRKMADDRGQPAFGVDPNVDILDDPKTIRDLRTNQDQTLDAGTYEVSIALPINDGGLMRLPDYPDLRRGVELHDERDSVENYFFPDRSRGVRLVRIGSLGMHLVKDFKNVLVVNREWTSVHALFFPAKLPLADWVTYVPDVQNYGFDDDAVLNELNFYEVSKGEIEPVLTLLKRLGAVVCKVGPETMESRPYRLFTIDVERGQIQSDRIESPRDKRGGG